MTKGVALWTLERACIPLFLASSLSTSARCARLFDLQSLSLALIIVLGHTVVPDAVMQQMKALAFCLHAPVASATLGVFRVGSRLQSRFISWFAKRLASRLPNSANILEGNGAPVLQM